MADKFDETAGKLARAAIEQVPGVGLMVDVIEAFVPPGANERLRAAIQEELEKDVERLKERIAELDTELRKTNRRLGEFTTTRIVGVARQFAEARMAAGSEIQIEALLNAAAHQFDPRVGDAATRAHWFEIVRKLSPIRILLLKLLKQYGGLRIQVQPDIRAFAAQGLHPVTLTRADCIALLDAAGEWPQISRSNEPNVVIVTLSASTNILADFITSPAAG